MRQYLPNVAVFIVIAAGVAAGWWYVEKTFFPKPEPKPAEPIRPARELVAAFAGTAVLAAGPAESLPALPPPIPVSPTTLVQAIGGGTFDAKYVRKPVSITPLPSAAPIELIALGDDS